MVTIVKRAHLQRRPWYVIWPPSQSASGKQRWVGGFTTRHAAETYVAQFRRPCPQCGGIGAVYDMRQRFAHNGVVVPPSKEYE